ncbi:TIGR04222 domain-containing membrane protein [Streptantibioticus rubrisoli]|uniref:TIGR04222 domain-containing membrane protein n=1 Tax=Streptantibioticus rubrisoli TaxID=1387313 RepID=A0ABT1PHX9_9ACTN|nr:TIGR04222 domain-containing membrane protein [Streptantibioticus rubrisoli]MCQ4044401.1 TIGR04222 domain-containing membrane protein [Streptantibioticus rubrisoli]
MWVFLVVVAWGAALVSCARLCRAAVVAARESPVPADGSGRVAAGEGELGLYEAAFLAGGPGRVTDLAMVAMSRQRRLLLAHTGWATVVDPVGRDEVERSLIASIGPGGQCLIPAVRTVHAAADCVRALGDRLASAGLAVPATARDAMAAGIRQTWAATVLVCGLLAASTGLDRPGGDGSDALWFVLPLVLTVSCLVIARIEVHPYTRWASPAGQELLRAIPVPRLRHPLASGTAALAGRADDRTLLMALALRGPMALGDPALRAALGSRRAA